MAARAILNFVRKRPVPVRDVLHAQVPDLQQAGLAAVYYGERMGGDFYDFLRVSPTRVLFGLLDVAGRLDDNHAIISAAQSTFRTLGPQLFAKEELNEAEAMVELCLQLNRTILHASGGVHTCPAFAGCYEETLGTVCYFNAGHTPGLVRDGTGVSGLPATGLPLGLFSHATCDASTVVLEPGAALLLVSRGVVDAKCGGVEYGIDSVKKMFHQSSAENAKEISLHVLEKLQEFTCTPPTHDDVTALALARHRASQIVATAV